MGASSCCAGRDFVVLGFGEDAEFPEFLVQILHKRRHAGLDRAEVVVLKLLPLGRSRAEKRSARVHQIAALFERLAVDEEVFLFGAYRGVRVSPSFCRRACSSATPSRLTASMERSRGVFLSRACPL